MNLPEACTQEFTGEQSPCTNTGWAGAHPTPFDCPSIREKALSSETSPGRWVSTAGFIAELASLRSKTQEISRLISLQWNLHRSTNHRFGLKRSTMILLCEHPVAVAGAKVENGFFVFQGRRPSFAPVRLDARAPNQSQRSSLRRPGAPAGCSRCERSLDTV